MLEVFIIFFSPSQVTHLTSILALEAVGVDPTQAKYTPSGEGIDKITFVKHL
jgi:hypothetical protein